MLFLSIFLLNSVFRPLKINSGDDEEGKEKRKKKLWGVVAAAAEVVWSKK